MVPLHRLNGGALHLNPDLIATVEEHHDTVITLVDGKCLVVAETAEQVVASVVRFRADVLATAERLLAVPAVHPVRTESAAPVARVLALHPEGH